MTARDRLGLDTSWKREAECGTADPRLFELEDGEYWRPGRFDAAAEICRRCPVLAQCDDYATRGKEKWGFWALKDRGEARYAQRVAQAAEREARERAALLGVDELPVPRDEGEAAVRLALAGPATGGGPDLCSA